jgi:hypothetical protein
MPHDLLVASMLCHNAVTGLFWSPSRGESAAVGSRGWVAGILQDQDVVTSETVWCLNLGMADVAQNCICSKCFVGLCALQGCRDVR